MTTDPHHHRHAIAAHLRLSPPPPTASTSADHHTSTKKPRSLRLFSFLQPFVMLFFISLFFLFVGIASIFVVHVLIAGRWYRHRHRHARFNRHLHHRHHHFSELDDAVSSPGLSFDQIEQLPCCDYESVLDSVSARDCAVCLEGFREGEAFRILPRCRHAFHAGCVEVWLRKASACPICRQEVVEAKE